jgi:four helix bundle protein
MAGARDFTDLLIYQLADELRAETYRLTRRVALKRDLRLRTQTDDAAESICRNIAEGFGAGTHPEFARYLIISRRSVNELRDCFIAAVTKRHVSEADVRPARALTERLEPALNSLIAYLDGAKRRNKPLRPPRPSPKRPSASFDVNELLEKLHQRRVPED